MTPRSGGGDAADKPAADGDLPTPPRTPKAPKTPKVAKSPKAKPAEATVVAELSDEPTAATEQTVAKPRKAKKPVEVPEVPTPTELAEVAAVVEVPEVSAAPEVTAEPEVTATPTAPPKPARPRPRVSIIGVLGELLITGGVVVLLFLGWQLWLNDIVLGHEYTGQAQSQSQKWNQQIQSAPERDNLPSSASKTNVPLSVAPTTTAKVFAALIIPRFDTATDPNFYRPIGQGVDNVHVLQKVGVGHYENTGMPGVVGNFAIASHRTAWGGALHNIVDLHVGDHIYIETELGWYQYDFRNLQYMPPTEVSVLDPVPESATLTAKDRILTMTTCNPLLSTRERMAAYAVFDTFYPRTDGPPKEIAATVGAKG